MSQDSHNAKKKKQAIILGALGLVFAAVLGNAFIGKKSSPGAEATQTGAPAPARVSADALPNAEPRVGSVFQRANVNLDTLVQEIKVVEFEYTKEHVDRDPTLPLVGEAMLLRARTAKAGGPQTPDDILFSAKHKKVTGIIWDAAHPLAVIDDAVVAVGFQFENAIFVKSIERDHVILGITGQDVEVVSELKEH